MPGQWNQPSKPLSSSMQAQSWCKVKAASQTHCCHQGGINLTQLDFQLPASSQQCPGSLENCPPKALSPH